MPRVSDEYRAARRTEILAAAARCFARDGFQATSINDITDEAGVASGSVYRYFENKDELIDAVIAVNLTAADDVFATLLATHPAPSPLETITVFVNAVAERVDSAEAMEFDMTRIIPHSWSEALRDPEIGVRIEIAQRRFREQFGDVARRWQEAGYLDPSADPIHVGTVTLGIVHAFVVQRLLVPGTTAGQYLAGVAALVKT